METTNARLRSTLAKFSKNQDPIAKELRRCSVTPDPFLLASFVRTRAWKSVLARPRLDLHKSLDFAPIVDGKAEQKLNKSLYLWEPTLWTARRMEKAAGTIEVIPIKLSSKCMTTQDEKLSLADTFTRFCKSETEGGSVPVLQDLLRFSPNRIPISVCDGSIRNSAFFQDLKDLFLSFNRFPAYHYESLVSTFRQKWSLDPLSLTLNMKAYPTRADLRAYCHDHDLVRHIVGSTLEAVFRPKHYNAPPFIKNLYPRTGNNTIDWRVIPKPQDRLVLTVLDIRSFTFNALNSWAWFLYLTEVLESLNLNELKSPFHVSSRGWIMEVPGVITLLRMYLFLAPMAPFLIKRDGVTSFGFGGSLGVSFNMVSTMMYFAWVVHRVTLRVISKFPHLKVFRKLGGDDFTYLICGQGEDVKIAGEMFKDEIELYVGELSEFSCVDLIGMPDGFETGLKYCKKPVVLFRGRGDGEEYVIRTQETLPALAALTVRDGIASQHDFSLRLQDLYQQVNDIPFPDERDRIFRIYCTWLLMNTDYQYLAIREFKVPSGALIPETEERDGLHASANLWQWIEENRISAYWRSGEVHVWSDRTMLALGQERGEAIGHSAPDRDPKLVFLTADERKTLFIAEHEWVNHEIFDDERTSLLECKRLYYEIVKAISLNPFL